MKRACLFAVAMLTVVAVAMPGTTNPGATAFTRAANAPGARDGMAIQTAVTPGSESWRVVGQDVVPFYYEQGMASYDERELVFSSRYSLTRTSVGCPDPLGTGADGCYDVRAERPFAIPPELYAQGFNHIGGIDVGRPIEGAPGRGIVFAALETDPPRTQRAYGAYDLESLAMVGLLVEQEPHRYHSWVAVDPSARYLVATEDGFDPIRVYGISRDESTGSIAFARRPDLDIVGIAPGLPNMQGCKFAAATTIYCANWAKRASYFDLATEIYRIDLSAPIGTANPTASWSLAFKLNASSRLGGSSSVPYGLETEDLAFWGGRLHVQLRGEAIGWVHIVHLEPS